ncbi:hypothetical protein ACP70R_037697 [Stipagrostis hirtigluma subsp. patula]
MQVLDPDIAPPGEGEEEEVMSAPGQRPPCAACRHAVRRCTPWCVFAPHFPADQPERFAIVNETFHARHVAELLGSLPMDRQRSEVALLIFMALNLPSQRKAIQTTRRLRIAMDAAREFVRRKYGSEVRLPPSGKCVACDELGCECTPECVFAPHFPPHDHPSRFAAVHKAFGAKNVAKILGGFPPDKRRQAVHAIVYSARARLRGPLPQNTPLEIAHAEELVAFVEVGSSVLPPRPPSPSFFQQEPPSRPFVSDPSFPEVDDKGDDPAPTPFVRAPPPQLVDAQQFAAVLGARRRQSKMARQAAADAHAASGSSSGATVTSPSQEPTVTATGVVADPSPPKADDQGSS